MTKTEIKLDHSEIEELEVKYSNIRSLSGWAVLLISAVAIISSLYHLYIAGFGMTGYQFHLSLHLLFMIVLAFFIYPISKGVLSGKTGMDKVPVYDLLLALLGTFVCLYWIVDYNNIILRSGSETQFDLIVGGIGIFLVLECGRRTVGAALSILAGIFLIYAYIGAYLPGILHHRGYTIERIISHLWYTDQGIFGVPLYVSATYVIIFIIFGSFLKYSGAGEFFINLAYALTGFRKGGPAKTAILASGFFGMISGSSIANAVTTGSFTIPLIKKAGYRKEFAGAIEAASSTGGQIMPPVMGAAAFIMVEFTGIPYDQIIISAAIPALAFFVGLWIMAHLEAGKSNLKSVPRSELPDAKKLIKEKGYMMISVFLLLFLIMVLKISIMYAAFFSILSIIALSYVKKETRMGVKEFKLALEEGTKSAVGVALSCACAGIISGVATLTGLGLKIATLVGVLSGGSLFIALLLTMIACLILGMGLPTTATYIVLVTMAAPAILSLQLPSGVIIPVLAVHLFVLYYGCLADITPPVALAAYATSGIAKSNQFWTGIEAFKISLNKLFVPYAFIYSPAILLLGIEWNNYVSVGVALFDIGTIFLGILCLQSALSGYLLTHNTTIERIFLFAAALSLIFPNLWGAIFGVIVLILVFVFNKARITIGPDGTTVDGLKKLMASGGIFK